MKSVIKQCSKIQVTVNPNTYYTAYNAQLVHALGSVHPPAAGLKGLQTYTPLKENIFIFWVMLCWQANTAKTPDYW